ncbi:hypothetical protein DL95DRAFT_465316 [Leptodontidium sp. 2 PMI_412]|nr:hypothetical protein DL95DRAFT_465316 [Leptodontidium sp. 2 PMI_412]
MSNMKIREGRGCGAEKDHIYLQLGHLPNEMIHERLPGIAETANIFASIDITRVPIPGQVISVGEDGSEKTVDRLYAAGEAACVSVHGANRLGANSPLDIVVFGRAVALHIAENNDKGAPHLKMPNDISRQSLADIERIRMSSGDMPSSKLRTNMQKAMQTNVAVF